jgi:hypothetical protein
MRKLFHWEFWPIWAGLCAAHAVPIDARDPVPVADAVYRCESRNPDRRIRGRIEVGNPGEAEHASDYVAEFDFIPPISRPKIASKPHSASSTSWPDVSGDPQAGQGRARVRGRRDSVAIELANYLRNATEDIIIQRYVDGAEFGLFYYRYPSESRGRICSITTKQFPEVVGDGAQHASTTDPACIRARRLSPTRIANSVADPCPMFR